jgi:hypothetical protein
MEMIDDGVTFRHMTVEELREEVLKLQTLAVAIGQCCAEDVPESVMKAWKEPRNYRNDEIHWLREKYVHLVEAAARVVRHYEQGKIAAKDDGSIERLRLQITGSFR